MSVGCGHYLGAGAHPGLVFLFLKSGLSLGLALTSLSQPLALLWGVLPSLCL